MSLIVFSETACIFAASCASIFVVIGVLGNFITILALLRCPKLRGHATTAFVLSLCVSDLLFCVFSLPLTAHRYFNQAWTLGETLCKIFPVIFYGNVAVSLLSMVGITLNRYILIAWNNIYVEIYKPKYIILQLTLVWITAFFMMLPPLLGFWGQLGYDETTFSCTILKKNGQSPKKYLFLIGFLVPCIVIIISYTCIYITVQKQQRKLKAHNAVDKTKNAYSRRKNHEDNRLTVMMLTIFLGFLLCFLPLMLANVIDENNKSFPWLHIFASIMAWASSVVNPFIYAASNRNYRVAYYKIFEILKFCGEPLSPISSKNFQASRNHDLSNSLKSKEVHIMGS